MKLTIIYKNCLSIGKNDASKFYIVYVNVYKIFAILYINCIIHEHHYIK